MWSPSQAIAARAAKRKSHFYIHINLWTFVSVLTVLVILFAGDIAMPFSHRRASVDLPTTKNASSQRPSLREDAMNLMIQRDGRAYFGRDAINLDQLPGLIGEAVQKGAEKRIYLKADSRAKFRHVKAALEFVQLTKITDITIITENSSH
jgi:biopolymer transport protein ExbD